MLRIEIVGAFDPQVFDLSESDLSILFNQRVRIHSRAPGFISALRMYGDAINDAIMRGALYLDDPEVQGYFEVCRVFHAGGSVVFHREQVR